MKFQSLGMFSGAIQCIVIPDTVEQLQDKDSELTPSEDIQQYSCLCSLQDLKVLAHLEEENRVPMTDAPLKPVK